MPHSFHKRQSVLILPLYESNNNMTTYDYIVKVISPGTIKHELKRIVTNYANVRTLCHFYKKKRKERSCDSSKFHSIPVKALNAVFGEWQRMCKLAWF